MKKLFTVLFAIALIFGFTGISMAGANGAISGESFAVKGDFSYDSNHGMDTIGGAGAIAGGKYKGKTEALNGKASAKGVSLSTAYAKSESWDEFTRDGSLTNREIGSESYAEATQFNSMEVSKKEDAKATQFNSMEVSKKEDAKAKGSFTGFAAEGTFDMSYADSSPFSISDGRTGALAGQGAVGGFEGTTTAIYDKKKGYVDADLTLSGGSYALSGRYIDRGEDYCTEGMYSGAGASTKATLKTKVKGCHVNGGYFVIGGAAASAHQTAPGAMANASMAGTYCGMGGTNTSYSGSVSGYANTEITKFGNGHGTASYSSSGVSVSSYSR